MVSYHLRAAAVILVAGGGGTLAFAPLSSHKNLGSFVSHDSFLRHHPAANNARAMRLTMMAPDNNSIDHADSDSDSAQQLHLRKKPTKSTQPTPVLARAVQDYLPAATTAGTTRTAAAASLAAAAVILSSVAAGVLPADAAMSGGRMGGSFSAPRSSGGGGRSMSPSRGFSGGGGGGYSRGGYSNYYAAPRTTIIAPFASPFYNPFYNPIYGGGVGAISYSRGPGLLDFLFLGGIGLFAVSAVSGALSGAAGRSTSLWSDDGAVTSGTSVLGSGTSVVRLSVALDVPNRDDPNSLLSVLDRLAATAKTDSRKGVQNLTSQVALELLRRKSSIQSAASVYKHMKDDRAAQRTFNQWSVQERSKFEQENISKFGGIDNSRIRGRDISGSSDKATMAVVTLVLSIQGDSTAVPMIRSIQDVENALRKIAADVKVDDCLTGAEILWTPEDRNEVLTRMDIIADYPELTAV